MKSWYMDGYTPNITGYESDALLGYARSNFTDVLLTTFSDTAILYNYDLSKSENIKCVIQNNTADTQLKSIERQILCTIGTLRAGMYLYFDGCFWLITGYPGNNKSYEKATVILCQYKLRWQKIDGTILERWCNVTSAAKYDVGESGNSTLVLTTNNFTILLPNDEDSMTIEGKRVFMDRNKSDPEKVFKITRNDDSVYDYGEHGGLLSLIANKTELNKGKDNTELMICNYISTTIPPVSSEETTDLLAILSGGTTLRCGRAKSWAVVFKDKSGNIVTGCEFEWRVVSDFEVSKMISSNKIQLCVNDENYIDSSFLLQVVCKNKVVTEITIIVIGGF